MHVALMPLLGCLLGVAIVAALAWDWWAHPDLTGASRSHRSPRRHTPAAAPQSATAPQSAVGTQRAASSARTEVPAAPGSTSADRRRLQPANA